VKRGASEQYVLTDDQVSDLVNEAQGKTERLLIQLMVYLGMRVSEVVHFRGHWIRQEEIHIPEVEQCNCSACANRVSKATGEKQARLERKPGYWYAKSKKSARSLPIPAFMASNLYDFFSQHPNGFGLTRIAVWQKVKRIAKDAGIKQIGLAKNTIFPHTLRATAATRFAASLEVAELMAIMGWSNMTVAAHYINLARIAPGARKKAKDILGG